MLARLDLKEAEGDQLEGVKSEERNKKPRLYSSGALIGVAVILTEYTQEEHD